MLLEKGEEAMDVELQTGPGPDGENFLRWYRAGLSRLGSRWGWFMATGVTLMLLGVLSFSYAFAFTIASVVFFGWLMLFGGLLQSAYAFSVKDWAGFFIDLLMGILYSVVGFLMINHPQENAAILTLLIALSLIMNGVFRIAIACIGRFDQWLWLLLHGAISLFLGISIWHQWPVSGTWVIGLFVGVDMLLAGWYLVMLALILRKLRMQVQSVT